MSGKIEARKKAGIANCRIQQIWRIVRIAFWKHNFHLCLSKSLRKEYNGRLSQVDIDERQANKLNWSRTYKKKVRAYWRKQDGKDNR